MQPPSFLILLKKVKEGEWPGAAISFLSFAPALPTQALFPACFCVDLSRPCAALHPSGKEEKKGEMKVSGGVGHTALRAVIEWEEGCLPARYCAQGHQ